MELATGPGCASTGPPSSAHDKRIVEERTIQPALWAGHAFAHIWKPTCGYAASALTRSQRRPFGLGAARVLALAAAVAGQLMTHRRTDASALSAISRQPLSMVSACPRPGIFSISVTPWLSCCCLKEALAIAHGAVWSRSPAMSSSGPRSGSWCRPWPRSRDSGRQAAQAPDGAAVPQPARGLRLRRQRRRPRQAQAPVGCPARGVQKDAENVQP
jgi:hypothetical protein